MCYKSFHRFSLSSDGEGSMGEITDEERLRQAIDTVDDGRSILVLGSGYSLGATNSLGENMPLASQLAAMLAKEIDEDEGTGLEEISGLYVELNGSEKLFEFLKKQFTCAAFSAEQKVIANVPWKRVYTTNYDDVFETSRDSAVQSPSRTTNPRALKEGLSCVHLNGFIRSVSPANFDDEIMLTDVQYLTNELRESPWASMLRSEFHSARNIFFIGYSLYDFDITKILFESNRKKKIFFIQHEELRRSQNVKFKRYGTLYRIGIEKFAEFIENRKPSTDPDLKHGFLSNFQEVELSNIVPAQPRIDDMRPLLSKGILNMKCIAWDLAQNSNDYRIKRPQLDSILPEVISLGDTVFVLGDIGSGKKFFVEELSLRYSNAEFRCFYFDGLSEDISDDIEYLEYVSRCSKTLVIFPDYYNHEHLLKLVRFGVPKCVLVTTSTIAAYELSRNKPFDDLEDLLVVDLEKLSDHEIKGWNNLLDRNALWGERANQSAKAREKFIKDNCRSRLRDLLLFLFDQEQIRAEIRSVFDDAVKSGEESTAQLIKFLAICASNHDPSFSEVQEILGLKFARVITLGRAHWTHELLALEDGRRSITSSIFAQYLLREFVSDRRIIDELSELALQLDNAARHNRNFSKLRNFPMRYSYVERIFSNTGKREKLVSYYEELRLRGLGINNPQFWLQYAIARMSFKDYVVAQDMFDTSYAKANQMSDYDTYQIDNHYARFLFESAIHSRNLEIAYAKLTEAHGILIAQMRSKKEGHYPYRVASNYLDFVEAYADDMSSDELEQFVLYCREIQEYVVDLYGELSKNHYVKKCAIRIPRAIEFAEEVAFGSGR